MRVVHALWESICPSTGTSVITNLKDFVSGLEYITCPLHCQMYHFHGRYRGKCLVRSVNNVTSVLYSLKNSLDMNCKQNVNKKKWKGRNFIDVTNFNRFEKSPIHKKKSNTGDATKNDAGKGRIFSTGGTRDNVGRSHIFYDLLRTPQYLNGNHKEKKKLPKMSTEAQNVLSSLHPTSTSKQNGKQNGEPKGESKDGLREPKRTLRKSWSTSMLWKGNKVESESSNINRRNESGYRNNVREFSPGYQNNVREFSPDNRNNVREFSPDSNNNVREFSPDSNNNVREFSPGHRKNVREFSPDNRNNSHCNSLPSLEGISETTQDLLMKRYLLDDHILSLSIGKETKSAGSSPVTRRLQRNRKIENIEDINDLVGLTSRSMDCLTICDL